MAPSPELTSDAMANTTTRPVWQWMCDMPESTDVIDAAYFKPGRDELKHVQIPTRAPYTLTFRYNSPSR